MLHTCICRSHLSKKHQYEQGNTQPEQHIEVVGDQGDHITEQPCEIERRHREALFILKVKEERKLTQTAINGLLMDIRGTKLLHVATYTQLHTFICSTTDIILIELPTVQIH